MKISFPRERRTIKFIKGEGAGTIYLIFGRYSDGGWWLQDFWKSAYSFQKYKDALKGAKKIGRLMRRYGWKDYKHVILKLEF